MDLIDVEENIFTASDAKLHGEMCKTLSAIYCRILSIFPSLEAARPRSKSGIQALCALHVALEKSKTVLLHCSECSKLYLAITGDSVLSKFEKTRSALEDSLRRVEDIVPQSIGCQIQEIVGDLEGTVFSVDPLEKQAGDEIIALLQQGSKFDNCNDTNELESFHQAATKLGITSSRAALSERRALKKLIERARAEEDKRKESIVAYLLHLMRKYSKLFRSDFSDDTDSQGSSPCSPTVLGSTDISGPGGNGQAFDRQLSKLSSFNFKPSNKKSDQMPLPPEELRCPISLQLMYDPVIIASGQTYERICIEKWFNDGHGNCPKTRQKLSHLSLTPNYCVKGLVSSWCEQNGVVIPYCPPESLDLNYWRLVLSECDSSNSKSVGSNGSCNKLNNSVKVIPLEESGDMNVFTLEEGPGIDEFETYEDLLTVLREGDLPRKCKTVEKIRSLLKDDEEARIYMGANGFVQALMQFLDSAVREENAAAQESAAMALFNLAVNNNRNKEIMMSSGIIPLLEEMTSSTYSHGFATALYLNLSCLEEAKPIIGSSSHAVTFLSGLLQKDPETDTEAQCKLDALHAFYNLSSVPSNAPQILSSGIVPALQSLLGSLDRSWTEKCLAVLLNLASTKMGKDEMASSSSAPGLIGALASVLDSGEPAEQEQAVSCLLIMCRGNDKCSLMVLQEGVIPALVSISVNGTSRGREKAQKLLMLFREQRQKDHQSASALSSSPEEEEMNSRISADGTESKPLCKSVSRRKMGKAFSFLWKRTYSVSQC